MAIPASGAVENAMTTKNPIRPMSRSELIRTVKAIQTQALQQRMAISGIAEEMPSDAELQKELHDADITAMNHIDALEHVIARLTHPDAPVGSVTSEPG